MFHLLCGDALRDVVQGVFVLLMPLMGGYNNGFFLFCAYFRKYLSLIEQKAQLLHEGFLALFGGRAELLVPGKAQCFHEHIHAAFKLRDTLALSLKFLVFRPGYGDCFRVACSQILFLVHDMIIPYFCKKV